MVSLLPESVSTFTHCNPDGLPATSLLKFKDPAEQEATVGPLFVAAAKSIAPIFGPTNLRSVGAKQKLTSAVKRSIHSKETTVIDLLAPSGLAMLQSSDDKSLELNISEFAAQHEADKTRSDTLKNPTVDEKKSYSSRELHERSHTSRTLTLRTISEAESPDNIMLRRALNGYFFDCTKNRDLTAGDRWLQDIWEWVAGKLPE